MKSTIKGEGFHHRRGRSVKRGEACEMLVQAAAELAFPEQEGWIVLRQFEPQFSSATVVDTFDIGIFLRPDPKGAVKKALILQVTQWADRPKVEEEPNKSYEVHETLEEITYLGSRVRVDAPTCINFPKESAFGNIAFGNRRYVRKWIPLHFSLFLDFVSYPSYRNEDGQIQTGLYDDLDRLAADVDDDEAFLSRLKEEVRKNDGGTAAAAGNRLWKQFSQYKSQDLPLSRLATLEYQAREKYRESDRFKSDIKFLKTQIAKGGLPASRFKLKDTFLDTESPVPLEWKHVIDAIRARAAEEIPEVNVGRRLLEAAYSLLPRILMACQDKDQSAILGLWNHADLPHRVAYREIMLHLSEGATDDFYDGVVTEQTFSRKVFDSRTTNRVLTRIMKCVTENAPASADLRNWIRAKKEEIGKAFEYMAVNGTKNTPTKWTLDHLLRTQPSLRKKVKTGGTWPTCTFDAVEPEVLEKYAKSLGITLMGIRRTSLRAEFTHLGEVYTHLKSKPTSQEAGRRAKEEGNKGWLGRIVIERRSKYDYSIHFSDRNLWIWVDGNWSDPLHLERLVECGWRVYLNPRDMITDFASLS